MPFIRVHVGGNPMLLNPALIAMVNTDNGKCRIWEPSYNGPEDNASMSWVVDESFEEVDVMLSRT